VKYTLALVHEIAGYIGGLMVPVPEALVFLLLGSALLALGFVARRSHR
jgi:hypothetical protein